MVAMYDRAKRVKDAGVGRIGVESKIYDGGVDGSSSSRPQRQRRHMLRQRDRPRHALAARWWRLRVALAVVVAPQWQPGG